jgi:aldose sugar dehydrogenase
LFPCENYRYLKPSANILRFFTLPKRKTMHKRFSIFLLSVLLLASCKKDNLTEPPEETPTGTPDISVSTVLTNQGAIWGFDLFENGNMIFTQKTGAIRLLDVNARTTTPVTGLPTNINAAGQGGMLDIMIPPPSANLGFIYVTYSIAGNFLRLARFTLNGSTATGWQVLHTTPTPSNYAGHYGSRLAYGPDGKIYWAVGEGGTVSQGGASSPNQNAQNLGSYWGKIHRMNPDGTAPADNPFINTTGALPTIFSYGHRNPQGMAFQPGTGRLFATEHGPSGGCELNLIEAGKNYGWPLYSHGINYNGTSISSGHNAPGITPPLVFWTPALAPSGLTFINHNSFKDWKGRLLAGSLGRRHAVMMALDGALVSNQTVLLDNVGRVRNVRQALSGKIYVSVESEGTLLEITAR